MKPPSKKGSKNIKARPRRAVVKTSPTEQEQTIAELRQDLAQSLHREKATATENVRLFQELKEALEQQTATSEILSVISKSPTDAQPVFDTIAQSAMGLCDAAMSVVSRYDGELIHLTAHSHVTAEGAEVMRHIFPMRPARTAEI